MGQTILITGASTGIGRATAELFAERGWNVVATMRTPDNGAELSQLDHVVVERLDVTDSASITAAVAATVDRFGSIDALVNNAGYGAYGPLEATSMEGIRRQFDTNVVGLLEVTKAVLPQMRAQQSGAIVNISSVAARSPCRSAPSTTAPSGRLRDCRSRCPSSSHRSASGSRSSSQARSRPTSAGVRSTSATTSRSRSISRSSRECWAPARLFSRTHRHRPSSPRSSTRPSLTRASRSATSPARMRSR